jgi:hypothetical protein
LLLVEYGKDRVNLLGSQIVSDLSVRALHRNRENSGCHADTCGIAKSHKAKERANRSQAQVSRDDRITPFLFDIVEKAKEGRRIECRDRQRCWPDARFTMHKPQQQSERVAIAGDGLLAEALLRHQMIGEEELQ